MATRNLYDLPAAHKALREGGARVTPQRALVLAVVRGSSGYLDANEIYLRARAEDPSLSLSTVYRTLRVLVDMGLVREIAVSEPTNRSRYEAADANERHFHLICQDCGGVVELNNSVLEQHLIAVAQQLGFSPEDMQFSLLARCTKMGQVKSHCGVTTDGRPSCLGGGD